MNSFSCQAIIIRSIQYGDSDLIINFLTDNMGKISAIAKYAKKSIKRFQGALELFNKLNIIIKPVKNKNPLILQEASIIQPFENIRSSIIHTAYASYFAEIINSWLEEKYDQKATYDLLNNILEELDKGEINPIIISILFQMHFLTITGIKPNLLTCIKCKRHIDDIKELEIFFNLKKGSIICPNCSKKSDNIVLIKKSIKELNWISNVDFETAKRIRPSHETTINAINFLENFLPYYLEKQPKSLIFIKNLRKNKQLKI